MGRKSFGGRAGVFFLLLTSSAFAAQVLVMNPQERLGAALSSQELNRIQVVGDRIASVFGSQGTFSVEPEEVKGQVFLKVPQGVSRLDLSVVTESGLTQDLAFTVQKGAGQTLLLTPPKRASETAGDLSGNSAPCLDLIKAMATSDRAAGYGRETLQRAVPHWRDVSVTLIEVWKGEGLEGHVYTVRNLSSEPKTFQEKQFRFSSRVLAVALDRFRVLPGALMTVYAVSKEAS